MKFKVFSVGKIDRREALEKYLNDSDANIQSWPTADDGKALADKDGGMFTVAFVKAGTTYIAEIYSRAEAEAESLFADAFDAAGPKAKRIALDAATDEALDFATATINTRHLETSTLFDEPEEVITAAGWGRKAGTLYPVRSLKNTAIEETWHSKDKRYWIFRIGAEWYAAEATGFGETDPVNTLAMINRTKPKLGKYVLDSIQLKEDLMNLKTLSAKLDAITEWAESRGFEMPALDGFKAFDFDVKDTGKTSYREALAGVDTQIPAVRFTKIENDPNAMGISDGGTHYVAVKKNGRFLLVTVYGASTEYVASQVINEAWAKKLRPGKATKEVEIYLDAIMTDAGDITSPMWATSLDREYKAAMLDGVQFKKDGADVFVKGAHGVAVLDGATFVTFTNEAGETFDEQNIVLDGILGK